MRMIPTRAALVAMVLPGMASAQMMGAPPPSSSGPSSAPSAAPPVRARPSSPLSAQAPAPVRYDVRSGFTLAFVDADVRRVIDAVLGSMLKADYTVDPKVEGNITLRTARPVTADSLVPLLERALQSVDAAIVFTGSGYRIVPRASARSLAPPDVGGGEGKASVGFSTEVVTLKYASAKEMGRLLEQFLGKDVVAGTEADYNQVLISGSAEERRAARALIARFDVDQMSGMIYSLIKLDNVDPESLLGELQRIFKPPYDILGTRVRVVPLPRMRSVLVVASSRSDIDRIEPWIHRLDSGGSGKRKLYSYAVQNGRARDVALALQLVLGTSVSSMPSSGQNASALGFSGSTTGTSTASGSTMAGSTGGTGKEPSDAIAAQTPLPGSSIPTLTPGGGGDAPRIVASDDTNSLLIYANGEEYDLIRSALDKIDLPVPQILIEATLAEVTLNNDFSAGVDWSTLSGNSSFRLNNSASSVPTAVFPGFSYGYLGASTQVVLNTLSSKTRVRVLSAPKLMVLNNQTATLQVGDQVPIVTQQSQSVAAAGAPLVNNIELHDTGVILKVTPRVNDSGTVQLDIAQEVSDVTPTTTSGINSPTIQQRRLATTVATRSGQMVALGGLIRNSVTRQRSGIPLLSEIPVVGAAFGKQVNRGDRTELIILLTPTVIRSPQDLGKVVDELIDRMDSTRPLIDAARARQVNAPPTPR